MLRASAVIQWQCSAAQVARVNELFRATLKWNMLRLLAQAHQARACANSDLVSAKFLENLDFDQKYL